MKAEDYRKIITNHCAGVALTHENRLLAIEVYIDDLADELAQQSQQINREMLEALKAWYKMLDEGVFYEKEIMTKKQLGNIIKRTEAITKAEQGEGGVVFRAMPKTILIVIVTKNAKT